MPAYRVYDIFNAKVGTTQVVGAEQLDVTYGYRAQSANNDGYAGAAARDKRRFWSQSNLRCQSLADLVTLLALWEAADSCDVLAEGKLAGNIVKSVRLTHKRTKLVGVQLSFMQGDYARTTFNLRGSADAASDASSDEVIVVEVASKTITHAAGLRGVALTGAGFTPDGGSELNPLAILGLELNINCTPDATAGDDEWGESVETGGYEVSGTLTFKDLTLDTGVTIGQSLLDAGWGALVLPFATQSGGSAGTLTLANLQFEEETDTLAARKFHANALKFSQFFAEGANAYTLATGTYKLITLA